TGLFLDHRITRSLVKENAADRNVLNLFGYTGSFSVYAAAGGAAGTTTVDLSGNYLQWAKRNMELNGFSGAEHSFVKADGREFLRQLPRTPYYDLAIVDPPTFSNSKDLESDWILQEHWAQLLKDLLVRMKPGGSIYFSTNYRQFKFEADQLQVENVREISSKTVPDDFRNQRIQRCWLIQVP
ncbi:MAG: class I SAM-dependent methyltransferase, partial [Pirellulaceae bacterium]